MITFKQFLEEAFTNPYDYKKTGDGLYEFNDIVVKIDPTRMSSGLRSFTIYFFKRGAFNAPDWNLSKDGDMAGTLRTFATILKIIDKDLTSRRMKEGEIISFSSYDKKTVPIYTRFAKSLSHKFNMEMAASDGEFMLRKR